MKTKNSVIMKFTNVVIFTTLFIILMATGCKLGNKSSILSNSNGDKDLPSDKAIDKTSIEAPVTPEPTPKFVVDSNERPIAVMIDNDDPNAWPHAGLEDAYVIYEAIVEGGSSRFMALFRGKDTQKIGPIRSSRHYFLDYVMENDAVYVHFGWSPKAIKDISAYKINKINGVLGGDESIFWREPKYKYDYHDVYTSIDNIRGMADRKKYRNTSSVKNFLYASDEVTFKNLENAIAADKITIPYSRYHTTYYEYDKDISMYKRWMRGKPHMLSSTKAQVLVKNIVIQYVRNYYLNDGAPKIGRQQLDTVGSGKGYYITNGDAINITWKKASRDTKTIYLDEQGKEIELNDGQTWIQITPIDNAVIIE